MFNRLVFSILSIVMVFSVYVIPDPNAQHQDPTHCQEWYLKSDFPILYGSITKLLSEQDMPTFQKKMGDGVNLVNKYATTDADPCFIALRDRFAYIAFNTLLFKNLIAYGAERGLTLPPALVVSIPQLLMINNQWENDMCETVRVFCDDVNRPPTDFNTPTPVSPSADLLNEAR